MYNKFTSSKNFNLVPFLQYLLHFSCYIFLCNIFPLIICLLCTNMNAIAKIDVHILLIYIFLKLLCPTDGHRPPTKSSTDLYLSSPTIQTDQDNPKIITAKYKSKYYSIQITMWLFLTNLKKKVLICPMNILEHWQKQNSWFFNV